MKVKILGFKFELGKGISLQEFISYLSKQSELKGKFRGFKQKMFIKPFDDNFHVGVIVTNRTTKNILVTEQNGDKIHIKPQQIGGSAKVADLNIFIINNHTKYGLYAYYHQSFGIRNWEKMLRVYYDFLKKDRITEAMESDGYTIHDRKYKKYQRQFTGNLRLPIILMKDVIDDLLDEIDEINGFNYYYQDLIPNIAPFRPLKSIMKTEKLSITFEPNITTSNRKSAIVEAIRDGGISNGNIPVTRSDGTKEKIPIKPGKETFGQWDFDEYCQKIDFDIDDLISLEPISDLCDIAKKHPVYFNC